MKLSQVWDSRTALAYADWIEDPSCGLLRVEKLKIYVRASHDLRKLAKAKVDTPEEAKELNAAAKVFDACASRIAEELSTIGERT